MLRDPRWYPSLDWAQIELRVRDVGGGHTPLVGLPGRLGGLGVRGSHPGPLAFYALAPLYRLFGASSWSLVAATSVLSIAAVGTVMWIVKRRLGWLVAIVAMAPLALLVHGYGAQRLAVPWNPWLPILWWFAFLLACWCVLCRDDALLPVCAAAGTYCAQTHIPYLPLVAGVLGTIACVVVIDPRRRNEPLRSARARWGALAVGILVLLWAPPFIDELVHDPGNLSVLRAHFVDAIEPPVGLPDAIRAALAHLDLSTLITGDQRVDGRIWPGVVLLLAWSAAAGWTVRTRNRELLALHATGLIALVVGTFAISRVLGPLWTYLVLWAWGTTAIVVFAIAMTARAASPLIRRHMTAVAAVTTIVLALPAAVTASEVAPTFPGLSDEMAGVMPRTIAKLDPSLRYLILWDDPYHAGSAPFAVLLELERAGIDAGLPPTVTVEARPWGVIDPSEADARVLFAAGEDAIERWRAETDAAELAHFEPSSAERRRAQVQISSIERSLRGDTELLELLKTNVFAFAIHPRTPPELRTRAERLLDLPVAASMFLLLTAPE